jgi:uncharacterized delta-60 repeat protein
MKKILVFICLSTFWVSIDAQVVDSTFGVLGSLLPIPNNYYGLTACDFDGRHDQAFSTLHLPDGRIILAGNSRGVDGNDIALARLMSDGNYDQTMGPDGQLRLDLGPVGDTCLTAILYGDNHLLLGGAIRPLGTDIYAGLILRTDLSGQPDSTFGTGGQVIIDLPSSRELVAKVRPLSDGKILIAGSALGEGEQIWASVSGLAFVGRLLANGQVDSTFGKDGFIYKHWEEICAISLLGDISLDMEGRIVITGSTYDPYIGEYDGNDFCTQNVVVCRYLPDGQVDSTFGTNGVVVLNTGHGRGTELLHYDDGRILVVGVSGLPSSNPIFTYLARLMPNGTLDVSFGGDGSIWTQTHIANSFEVGVGEPFGVVRLPGRIVVGALIGIDQSHGGFGAIALTENGRIDSTFAKNGGFSFFEVATPICFINEITSTGPDNFFLSGYYHTLWPNNMFIGKVKTLATSGLGKGSVNGGLTIFPNPVAANKHLYIDMGNLSSGGNETRLLIFRDLNGKIVYQQACADQTDIAVISTASLLPGIYLVDLCGKTGRYLGRLVVIGG